MLNLLGGLIFGAVGMIAFASGKRQMNFRRMGLGVALMVYPYFVPNPLAVYLVGVGLVAALFLFP